MPSRRGALFAGICAVSLAVATAAVAWAALSARPAATVPATATGAGAQVLFRSRDSTNPETNGRVAAAPLSSIDGPRRTLGRQCVRSYFTRTRGLCLAPKGDFLLSFVAQVLDPNARVRHELRLRGFPSRARISPDGRFGAVTTFVRGHSYAVDGAFSTRTVLLDLERGAPVAELQDFTLLRDGKPIRSADVNYWGVTFMRDSTLFYATVGTGGSTFLVEGDTRARTATVRHENVECPALSPDETRIAYKKRVGGPGEWRIHVLDLATLTETPLSETRSVDDQVEWLDDHRVLYGHDRSVWTAAADGSGAPRVFIPDADSPAVLR